MKAYDFEFNNRRLSEFDMVICNFGSKGLETISNGSTITFNTISTLNGAKHNLSSTVYESCLETTIQICKSSCSTETTEITATEFRELTKWLSRKEFLKFKILDEDHIDIYYEAAITDISRIEINGRIYGLELNIITNSPFAYKEQKTIVIDAHKDYMWEKFNSDPTIINNVTKTNIHLPYKCDIIYSNGINIDGRFISLVESKSFPINDYIDFNNLVGKYIQSSSLDSIAFIPQNANISVEVNNAVKEIVISELRFYENKKKIDTVFSSNRNDYPDDGEHIDGFWYIYNADRKYSINDVSYEESYIYPYMEITIKESGNLKIHNAIENRDTYIGNCTAGEVITLDYPIIQTSDSSHDIQNYFNWNFFRIANTYENSRNDLTISLPCIIKLKYSPVVKVGL